MGFSKTTYSDIEKMGIIPAKVNRLTGVLTINSDVWPHLPRELQKFIKLHELGHLELQTDDEQTANQYALDKFINRSSPSDFARTTSELARIHDLISTDNEELKKQAGKFFQQHPHLKPGNEEEYWIAAVVAAVAAAGKMVVDVVKKKKAKKAEEERIEQQKWESLAASTQMYLDEWEMKVKNNRTIIIAAAALVVIIVLAIIFKKMVKK